ncbi:hypothetical protein [Cryobacterium sp. MDB2-33-2]|uniref:hypothetical protein n=1 Tax=Cryobacterium sp. MDB2-33-2 TaxID=1259179 RepID=UPI00106DBA49|nr:hypothetical protein [Cryobacterium sp. MDB2-33-2]TFC05062.1 hypothetical protein E3O59_13060 [Cryobacterium sp. MDB2-33-2]
MSNNYQLRKHAQIANANASAAADLLRLRVLEQDERFIEGVVAAAEVIQLRQDVFASDVAVAYPTPTIPHYRKESVDE